ncbi:MAG: hypothetical protein HFI21_16915 [Lachnospiraceae bacterium]|uniref:hypothetical protein n=1 Tax=Candidatus Merdisoma sp. JLR.KK011 TaxID=3114299 RepID=UPI002FEFB877|nr:hypothetical protein [Lachnospiraceae bacterium]
MSDKRSFFQFVRCVLFLFILGILFRAANYCLYNDNTYTRVMFHEMYNSEQIDAAFIGSSNVYRHFVPEIWDKNLGMCTFNLGTSSQTPDDAYFIMKELFKNQSPKYCIYGINSILFLDMDVYNDPVKSFIVFDYLKPSLNKCVYGYIAFQDKSLLNAWIPATRSTNMDLAGTVKNVLSIKQTENYQGYGYEIYETPVEDYRGRGFVYSYKQTGKGEVGRLTGDNFSEYQVSDKYMFYVKKLKKLCCENDCELIFIVPPFPYASMAWQRDYQAIQDFYIDIADELDVILFNFDLSRPGYLFMEDSDFYDYGHMSGKGAEKFSRAASKLVKKYLDGEEIDRNKYFYSSYEELLDNSPWIFNTWIEKTEDGYTALSTYGNGVNPEYCYQWSEDKGETWHILQAYSKNDQIADDEIPAECNMLMVWAKPEGVSMEETDYQQCYRMELK